MRKVIYLITLNILYSALCFAAAPAWKLNLEKQFPSEKYVRAIGEGATESAAKKAAVAELSEYFSQKIVSTTESHLQTSKNNERYKTKEEVRKSVTVHSDSELFCVSYTDSWTDPKSRMVFVCAYINRNEAWDVITQNLKGLEDKCNKLANLSDNEKEPFKKSMLLSKAKSFYSEYFELYEMAVVLFPKRAEVFSAFISEMDSRMNDLSLLKDIASIQVKVSGDMGNTIYTRISELLSKNGFKIYPNGGYQLTAVVTWNESKLNEFYSAYPNIKIVIAREGKTFASFTGECEKVAAYNQESMQRMAMARLEELLDKCFIKECFE